MKKIVFLLVWALAILQVSAQQDFDCHNFNSYRALSKYNDLKHLGLNYKMPKGNKEVIPLMVEVLGENGLRQICIDAAYDDHLRGTESNYKRYINSVKQISRDEYMRNYPYLEIFSRMVSALEKHTNYRRQQ